MRSEITSTVLSSVTNAKSATLGHDHARTNPNPQRGLVGWQRVALEVGSELIPYTREVVQQEVHC